MHTSCDVSIFKLVKLAWKQRVLEYKQQTSKYITKATFVPIFKQASDKPISVDAIRNDFKACGLFPLDANAIDYKKCI